MVKDHNLNIMAVFTAKSECVLGAYHIGDVIPHVYVWSSWKLGGKYLHFMEARKVIQAPQSQTPYLVLPQGVQVVVTAGHDPRV